MVKVGQIELKGELVMIDLNDLVEDVPVNLNHVHQLMVSLKSKGQLQPLLVHKETNRIIDGFHREGGMRNLGWEQALCMVYSCSEEDFWSLRISSAVTHKEVTYARVVEWVRKSFTETKWAKIMGVEDAFRVGRRGAALHKPITPEQRLELTEWVETKSKDWDLKPQEIRDMLKIAQFVPTSVIKGVRDETTPGSLTQNMLQVVAKLPNPKVQERLVSKIRDEKLTLKSVQELVEKILRAKTDSEKERLLKTVYQKQAPRTQPRNVIADLRRLRNQLVTEALEQLAVTLPELERPQAFDEKLNHALAIIAIYLGGEDTPALEILQRENQSLNQQVRELTDKSDRKDRDMDAMRRQIGSQRQEIDRLIRRD